MDKFDRELQRYLLTVCIRAYPRYALWNHFEPSKVMIDNDKLHANIVYLQQHGLIDIAPDNTDDPASLLQRMRATAAGVDFMLDDGGLSAILKVQTIKLHSDTVDAIEKIITQSNLPEPEKVSIVSKLRELPADAIKHLTLQLLSQGLARVPDAIQLIQTALR
ncbi:hypothetical protein [Serratia sp. JKS296]|uniref:hypothetical protein n=1 Tax=Serratia sp. JKS296 TaxID=1938824 RepID=UPI00114473AA|nr:hypothetical protein [Serratia sp. JKS296]